MNQSQTIRYEQPQADIARIVLAREAQRNAQDKRMTYELNAAFDRAARDTVVKGDHPCGRRPTLFVRPRSAGCSVDERIRCGVKLGRIRSSRRRRQASRRGGNLLQHVLALEESATRSRSLGSRRVLLASTDRYA